MVVPGGTFLMGSEDADIVVSDAESPVRETSVVGFAISPFATTNEQFSAFVRATGYITEAEKFGWSYVFGGFLSSAVKKKSPQPAQTPWWYAVAGATWEQPYGPGSGIVQILDHPVVHVSWADAQAYCDWVGGRLPTENEWEYAARGGLVSARFPWGDLLHPEGKHMANIFQGTFPSHNTAEDGFAGTCPVDSFEANGYGLFNMVGNVWEMCADVWRTNEWQPKSLELTATTSMVMRGGSYLCHDSYCNRYRVAARTCNTAESSGGNQGFRVVFDQ